MQKTYWEERDFFLAELEYLLNIVKLTQIEEMDIGDTREVGYSRGVGAWLWKKMKDHVTVTHYCIFRKY